MNKTNFSSMQDLHSIYCVFSTEDLNKERSELMDELAKMVSNPEIVPRLSMVNSLLEERAGSDKSNG